MRVLSYLSNLIKVFPNITYNQAFALYAIFVVIWFWPFIIGGQVIAPCIEFTVNNDVMQNLFKHEIPYVARNTPNCVEHSDYILLYIPEAYQMLNSNYYHWIPTWIAEIGFGGMLPSSRGASSNYFPTFIVSLFTDNPYVFFTWIHMSYVFVSGFVFVAYMKLLRLHPLASVLGGITYATLPIFTFWATQTPFYLHAVWFIVLVLSIHSALLTTYPQALVFLATILTVFVVYLMLRVAHSNSLRIKYLTIVGVATVLGLLLTVPIWMDFFNFLPQVLRTPVIATIPRVPIEDPRVVFSYFFTDVFSVVAKTIYLHTRFLCHFNDYIILVICICFVSSKVGPTHFWIVYHGSDFI